MKKTAQQIEWEIQKTEAEAAKIRSSLSDISDEDLVLFAEWLARTEGLSVTQLIEFRAYDEFHSEE